MTYLGQSQREQKGSQIQGPESFANPASLTLCLLPEFLSRPSLVQSTSKIFSTSKIVSCHTTRFVGF